MRQTEQTHAQTTPRSSGRSPQPHGLHVEWARCLADVRAAQRLRYRVFVEEGGARLPVSVLHHELDAFDPWCEHLLVRSRLDGEVIGTYRVLPPEKAQLQGGLYAESEFDVSPLAALRPRLLEVGRACVHPDHRNGSVILMLWHALAEFMQVRGLDALIGCASVPMHDGGHLAASLWQRLRATHLAPRPMQVRPRLPLPVERLNCELDVEAPPLVKGYLRLGAKVLGAPAWDPDFMTADLPMMVRLDDMPARYRRHFLSTAAVA